jgi:rod shape-determining protein MreC
MISATGHSPPPFFKRGPAPLAQLFFYTLLSVALLVADVRFHALTWVRTTIATFLWPAEQVAEIPLTAVKDFSNYFARLTTLERENAELRRQRLVDAALLLRQRHLEDENQRLRALLEMRDRQPATGQVAQIMHAARDPFSRRVIIDKGLRQNIQPGQAVIDERGVIGQVVRSFPLSAEVLLLTDKWQAIPVQVQRNGLRTVLAGAGSSLLEMRFLAANADIQVGDILLTSGLDGIYPAGLPVARVIKIEHGSGDAFGRVFCTPLAGVEQHDTVLVLDAPPSPPAETAAEPPAVHDKVRKKP